MDATTAMPYRRLGRSGLQVSALSFGSWVTFGSQVDTGLARECLSAARDGGVNFFDNAESYAGGESESIMGRAIAELGAHRVLFASDLPINIPVERAKFAALGLTAEQEAWCLGGTAEAVFRLGGERA